MKSKKRSNGKATKAPKKSKVIKTEEPGGRVCRTFRTRGQCRKVCWKDGKIADNTPSTNCA